MFGKLQNESDWVTVLAFFFGAAVIVPDIAALGLTLLALARAL